MKPVEMRACAAAYSAIADIVEQLPDLPSPTVHGNGFALGLTYPLVEIWVNGFARTASFRALKEPTCTNVSIKDIDAIVDFVRRYHRP